MDPIPPEPTPVNFSIQRTDDRSNSTIYAIEAGKVFKFATTKNNTNTATINFTQAEFNAHVAKYASSTTGKGNASVNIDLLETRVGNQVVKTEEGITLTEGTPDTENISNSKDLYSHLFTWYGDASIATFTVYDQEENAIGTGSPVDYSPDPEGVRLDLLFFNDEKITTVDVIGTKTDYDNVTANNVTIDDKLVYTGGSGINGEYDFVLTGYGDEISFAITPTINEVNSVTNTTITATSIENPQYTYTENVPNDQIIFSNVGVDGQYQITIESNEMNKPFFTTIDTVTVENKAQQNIIVDVDKVLNNQDISISSRDFDNINQFISNYTIALRNADTGAIIDTKTTDASGTVLFEDVPGQTNVEVVGSANGYYTKTSGVHTIPFVQFVSQADTTLNVLGNQKITYGDGSPVNAEQIMWYLPNDAKGDYTPFALDELIIFFPEADQQATAIQHMTNAANLVGLNNFIALDDISQFQGYPTGDMIGQYNPFPGGETFPGQITTNVTSYGGTSTNTEGKILPNGRRANFYTLGFNLGGTDESRNHHEFTNLNWASINGNVTLPNGEFFVTTRDVEASENVAIQDSKWDMRLLPYTLQMQKNHYTQTDSEGRLIEYSMPTKFEE